ncbi:MAG: DUF3105 domain-containing protein [Lewinellaceae bacterium]|nr:DUF3105 domain-containing protein [Lewinellaceae bacterium]
MSENIENKNTSSDLSAKEQYELKRQKKKEDKTSNEKVVGGKMSTTAKIVWGVVLIGVIALVVAIVTAPKIEKVEVPLLEDVKELGEKVPIQTVTHIGTREDHAEYNSNPPTSGPHYAEAPGAGFYKKGLKDEEAVHGLEHGNIWISYTSEVDEETVALLEGIYLRNLGSVILSPREENDAPIVLASWGRKLELQEYDESTIYTYIKLHKNESPEPFAK